MANFYIVLAGIEINRVKTNSAGAQLFAGTLRIKVKSLVEVD
jgi:hypothetical protein